MRKNLSGKVFLFCCFRRNLIEHVKNIKENEENIPMILIGNKNDLGDREVSSREKKFEKNIRGKKCERKYREKNREILRCANFEENIEINF